jgi:hypothetical protein
MKESKCSGLWLKHSDSMFKPSEKQHEAAKGALRPIKAKHAPRSLSKKCHFPQLEIQGNVSASRHIVIMDINRYYMFAGRASFRAQFSSIIENKLYCGTGYRCHKCYSNPTHPNNSSNLSPTTLNELSYNPNHQLTTCKPDAGQRKLITIEEPLALTLH